MFEVTLFPFLNPIILKKGDRIVISVDEQERQYIGTFIGVMRESIFIEMWSEGYIVGDIGIPAHSISAIEKMGVES